ncbi:hypothetical protein BpHYR1_053437 [Brachionus plicatilis]|uniref:Uncharacterized protein n=1 Tax=Brachionus plicatilis TaxID=10195 RepID=A0A3M7QI94_BRAPC|nr:hypothetical protein BpHYR1_053437 [Brachionus plicatilis]
MGLDGSVLALVVAEDCEGFGGTSFDLSPIELLEYLFAFEFRLIGVRADEELAALVTLKNQINHHDFKKCKFFNTETI